MKHIKMAKSMLLALALVGVSAFAMAQAGPPPGGGGQGGPPPQGPGHNMRRGDNLMFIVRMPTVQTHLNLTQAQKDAIAALPPPPPGGGPGGQGGPGGPGGGGQGGPGGPGGGGQGGPGGPPPGGGGQGGPGGPPPGGGGQGGPGGPPPGGGGQGGPGGQGGHNPLAGILNQQQMHRLGQLGLQFDAPMTMVDPQMANQLNLTQTQRQGIHQAIQTNNPPPQPNQPRPTFAQMQQRKLAAFNAAWGILTQEQKDSWNQKVGPRFTNWVEPPHPTP